MKRVQFGWLAGLLVAIAGASAAQANPIVPANDGVGSVVNRVGNQFDITGGTRAGQNLFHSLLKFGLSQEQIANFLSQPSIRNILTRVTGGETSVINGLIKVTGGNSNLYLLNPAGLVFGPNAQLDIPGSFYGTTANAIKVGDGWFGLNTAPSELQRLTGNPGGFAFSSHNQVLNGELAGIIKNEGQLRVPGGERVVLAGGIVVNTGTIETPHGQIVVTATPGGRYVEITPAGSALSFRLPVAEDQALAAGNLRPLRLEDVARLATGRVEVGGTLTTASSVVNPNSRIELVGEEVKLVRGITISTAGTTGLIQVQVNPLVPVTDWVFVDNFPNFEDVVSSLAAGSRLVLLNWGDSGVETVHRALAGQTGLKGIHVVGDGNRAQIWFGRDFITPESLERYAEQIARWGQYLDKDGGIFLYTCNLAETVAGKALVDRIAQLTGRSVSASTDVTGPAKYGGNWLLEYGTAGNRLPFVVNRLEQADVKLELYSVTSVVDPGGLAGGGPFYFDLGQFSDYQGSLRQAFTAPVIGINNITSAGPHRVRFALAPGSGAIQLTAGEISINAANTANQEINFDIAPGGPFEQNVTIIADPNNRIFNIADNHVVSFKAGPGQSLTLQGNGTVTGNGGVILVGKDSRLELDGNVTVRDGQVGSGQDGGGIYLTAGSSNVTQLKMSGNAQVINNQAAQNGGGVFAEANTLIQLRDQAKVSDNVAGQIGGGIFTEGKLEMLGQSQVSGNEATNNFGGGIAVRPGGIAVIQDFAQVSGNKSNKDGGGIDNEGTVTLKGDAKVIGNIGEQGGGIWSNGTLTLQDRVQVINNQANVGDKQGGGIYVAGGTVTLGVNAGDQVKVLGNQAQQGGGLYVKAGQVTLDKLTQIGGTNTAIEGGGIYVAGGTVDINGETKVINNKASKGGGIYYAGGNLNFSPATGKVIQIDGNQATVAGGGIYHTVDLNIPAGVVVSNNQANRGGGIFVPSGKTLNLSGQVGPANKANQGAGIYAEGTVNLQGTASVIDNKAVGLDAQGGGIYLAPTGTLSQSPNAFISGNEAKQGGGIYFDDADGTGNTITNVTGNTANQGAGIFIAPNKTLILDEQANISGNTAKGDKGEGGGVYISTNSTLKLKAVTKDNAAILNNQANKGGGIFAAAGSFLEFQPDAGKFIIIQGNKANQGPNNQGGGIYSNIANLTIEGRVKILGNQATDGGGIFVAKATNLVLNAVGTTEPPEEQVLVQNNKATRGGGIFADQNATVTLKNNQAQVVGNQAVQGAGIYAAQGVTVTLQNQAKLTGNTADQQGGGIYAEAQAKVLLGEGTQVGPDNKAAEGAGIFGLADSKVVLGQGSKVSGNGVLEFGTKGGGIYTRGRVELEQLSEVTGNKAGEGGGIYLDDGGQLEFVGTQGKAEVVANQAKANGGGLFINTASVTIGDRVLINQNTADQGGGIFVAPGKTLVLAGKDVPVEVINNSATKGGGIFANAGLIIGKPGTKVEDFAGSTVIIKEGAKVYGNTASQDGGGIYVNATSKLGAVQASTLILQDGAQVGGLDGKGNPIGNKADRGGGIFAATASKVDLQGKAKVLGNAANQGVFQQGGGIFVDRDTDVTIGAQVQVLKNTANQGGGVYYVGGLKNILTVQDEAQIINNSATEAGGGIFTNGKLDVTGTAVIGGNTANQQGGGIFGTSISKVTLKGSSLVGQFKADDAAATLGGSNTALEGAGVYTDGILFVTESAKVSGNDAGSGKGGGIFAANGSVVILQDTAQIGGPVLKNKDNANKAIQGGGIFVDTGAKLKVGLVDDKDAPLVIGNTATQGGGIFVAVGTKDFPNEVTIKAKSEVTRNTATSGGGIFTQKDSILNVQGKARITANTATDGGGIFAQGIANIFEESLVEANTAARGGGIFAEGVDTTLAQVTVDGKAQIVANRANDGDKQGGGIFASQNSLVTVKGSTKVVGNVANQGGGIFALGAKDKLAKVTVQGSALVIGNTATTGAAQGGGVFAGDFSQVTLTETAQVGGTATGESNTAAQGAGIFAAAGGTVTVDGRVQVIGNKANVGAKQGGGIFAATKSNVTVQGDAKVLNNVADQGGGLYTAGTTLLKANAKVSGNLANQGPNNEGGGIYAAGGTLTLTDNVLVGGTTAAEANKASRGGGIFAFDGIVTLESKVLVSGNQANTGDQKGGGIFVADAAKVTLQGDVLIGKDDKLGGAPNTAKLGGGVYASGTMTLKDNVKVSRNTASDKGGGIYTDDGGNLTFLNNVQVRNNTAVNQGGGIYSENGDLLLKDNVKVIANGFNPDTNIVVTKEGGGIYADGIGTLTLDGQAQVTENKAALAGGGAYITGSYKMEVLGESQVSLNKSFRDGGGVFVKDNGRLLLDGKAKITGNEANQQGGGIFSGENAIVTLRGNTTFITDNKAVKGAALYASDSVVTADTNVEITGNKASQGGGLYLDKGTSATIGGNVLIKNNGALLTDGLSVGGGVFAISFVDPDDPSLNRYTTVQIGDNVKILDNSAQYGGGIYVATNFFDTPLPNSTDLKIGGEVLIQGNKSIDGGGIYADAKGLVTIGGKVKITQNSALGSGAGVVVWQGAKATVQGTDTLIADNVATFGGGGILVGGNSTLTIQQNVQISDNKAQFGGGIFAYSFLDKGVLVGPSVLLRDNVKVTNNNATDGGGIYADGGQTKVTLQASAKVADNKATRAGGGVVAWNGALVNLLTGASITGNQSPNGSGVFRAGGATFNNIGGTISGNTPLPEVLLLP